MVEQVMTELSESEGSFLNNQTKQRSRKNRAIVG
ncbi:protein of unknown function [Latilactobacillus sakei]|nr:protein of unknown function [Latilactobacillus sakei]